MQRSLSSRFAVACFVVLIMLFAAKAGLAQAVTGEVLGTVVDSTGAAIPGADITLTNEGTDVSSKTTSGSQGFYTFPNLNPGMYTVVADAKGFKKLTSQHNTVLVEQETRVDLTLSPGAISEQVTVTGQTPLVESTSSDLGETIDQTQISNLPVNGRLVALVMQLAPGTTPAAWGAGNPEDASGAASTAPGGAGGGDYTSANGFPFQGNLYLVDGVSDVELMNAYMGIQIPFAMVGEMKLETSDPTAEYGTFGGMVSNITTKSGGNRFHGQVFEFNRNTDFNWADYFSQINPPFHSNQFGAEVDGPIIKNKLFFSADFQWLKEAVSSSGITSVPTAAARSGDLSGFDSGGAGPITNAMACYYSAVANGVDPGVAEPCTASDGITVAGTYDTVPAVDINPIAGTSSGYLQSSVWPLPNLSGDVNNATYIQGSDASMPQEDARVDYAFSDHDRFFARMSYATRNLKQPLRLGASTSPAIFMNNGNANATNVTTNDVVGWDHTFSPNMMNQLRIGFSRFASTEFSTAAGIAENNLLGVPNGNITAFPDTSGIANVNIGPFLSTGDPGWVPQGLGRLSNIYQYDDAFTLVKGRSNWKFGFAFQPIQARCYNPQNDPRGQFYATGNYTGTGSNGASIADWLVGALNGSHRDQFFDVPNTRVKWTGLFAQNDFRVSTKLTLNLGVRYDVYTAPVDTKNKQSNFVISGPNAGLNQIADSSNRSPNVNTEKWNISPRAGFAYTPDNGKTALRAAVGFSYFPDNFGADGGTLERNYPFDEQENNNAPQSNCLTPYTANAEYSACGSLILANGLPGNVTTGNPVYQPIVEPAVTPGGYIAPPVGFGVYEVASNFRQDQAVTWNVSLERSLGANMSIHAAYVGTAGNYLFHDWQLNQCNPTSYTVGPTYAQLQDQYGTDLYPSFPNCMPYYNVAPNVSTIDFRNSGGKSHYNAGQFLFQRRTGANLTFTAAYTWSKAMDNINNPIDSYDFKEELDTAGWQHNNYPHVVTLTYVYTLPFGRGQRFANSISNLEDDIVGGWSISGITNFRSGAPLLMSASSQYLLPQNGGQRANYNCATPVNPHTKEEWFQTTCFTQPVGFVFGNATVGDGHIYGPRYQDWDMTFSKAIHITEAMHLQFQASFFNIFNHVNYQTPDTNQPDGSFGVVSNDYLPRMGQLGMTLSF
ncbi:MAG: TonB-dependent receptor [Terracidiphilus sp.]